MLMSAFVAGLLAASQLPADDTSLWRLYEKRDFFSLEREIPAPSASEPAEMRFLRAQTYSAFGEYNRANLMLRDLLQSHGLNSSLERPTRERLMLNERAMFHYSKALAAIQPLLDAGDTKIQNRAALLRQLQNVAPEELRRPAGPIVLSLDRFGAAHATVNGALVRLGIDTGANLSALSYAAAQRSFLHIRRTGYRIRLADSRALSAEVAVAKIELANRIEISNVVFLILPDSVLRIGSHRALDGLIGLPELSQLGPLRLQADGTVVLNASKSLVSAQPIALIEGDPVIEARFRGHDIFCRIDTGSNRTFFYRQYATRPLPPAAIAVGGRALQLDRSAFLRRWAANQKYESCSLGRDTLNRLRPYTLDLHDMRMGF